MSRMVRRLSMKRKRPAGSRVKLVSVTRSTRAELRDRPAAKSYTFDEAPVAGLMREQALTQERVGQNGVQATSCDHKFPELGTEGPLQLVRENGLLHADRYAP